MDRRRPAAKSPAQQWRDHCEQNGKRFAEFRGTAADRKRLERREEECIAQMLRRNLLTSTRAVAFRCLLQLRDCTARDVAAVFSIEPAVIAEALSLLEVPRPPASHVATPRRAARNSRNYVA